MENFRFDPQKIVDVAEALFYLTEQQTIPHVINIKNIQHIVVPDAFRFINYPKQSTLVPKETLENSVITADNLNNYMIVPVDGARINILSNGRWIITIELYTTPRADIVETFDREYTIAIRHHCKSLCEALPFDLTDKSNEALYKKVTYWLYTTTSALSTTLTLIHTLFNFDEKIKVTSYSDPHTVAQYIENLRNMVRNMGDNFFEVVENLYIFKLFV